MANKRKKLSPDTVVIMMSMFAFGMFVCYIVSALVFGHLEKYD